MLSWVSVWLLLLSCSLLFLHSLVGLPSFGPVLGYGLGGLEIWCVLSPFPVLSFWGQDQCHSWTAVMVTEEGAQSQNRRRA